jgi:replicative superfamily II helicase
MSHWILDNLSERRAEALKIADRIQIYHELLNTRAEADIELVRDIANALELAAFDLILERFEEDDAKLNMMRECAADAFRLYRVLPQPVNPLEEGVLLLRMSALAVLGDKGADAARLLRQREWNNLPLESDNWSERTWATILDIWLRLIRKKGWEDRDTVLERVTQLRKSQNEFEMRYLEGIEPGRAKAAALELIGLYHLAKAAEIFALFITDGVVEGNHQVRQMLDTHFDRVFAVCEHARMLELEPLTRLLAASSAQMVENSIWTVSRSVNTRVTHFVRTLVDRGRGDKAIFDVLPPQRRTLAEKGLLGSSRRAVVVSLPTSSGKTLIAQFRILQALNQFDNEEGWVAYLAPTRTLVNQVTRQLRRDFAPLNIIVEQVSPAMEVDTIEMSLLQEEEKYFKFRVLVTTPEKLDLMLRQGWEAKIGRPLTLIVVDEAHNIQNVQRGLKLELLLATINKECEKAQFLLLTPFIKNAREIARWLGGQNSDDISMTLDWQPNDRVIGIIQAKQGNTLNRGSYDYALNFESVHTTRKTITVEERISFPKSAEIAKTFSQVNNQGAIAAVTAQYLQQRGPVIIMHSRPDWVWGLANKLKVENNRIPKPGKEICLVQDYLRLELGDEFPLIELLGHGIGVHHAGLPDDIRSLIEWLFESDKLKFLVATTTIAQGVNFPVSGVVMASHQYPYGDDMPSEDFWNLAGRAGRVTQGQLGVIALAADSEDKAATLRNFINNQTRDLNSALVQLAIEADDALDDLGRIVYSNPEWSSFLQYLAHTYRQMGEPDSYFEEIEQVLRGTLGFEKLRLSNSRIARRLLGGIEEYSRYLQEPNQPLKLVDSTGFSLQSIKTMLTHKRGIDENSWDESTLFTSGSNTLQQMMGVLLRVPELRDNLKAVTGENAPDGNKLALIIKDWVNGESLLTIADRYFNGDNDDQITALTKCGQNLFGKLAQTASWGLGALIAITASNLPEEQLKQLSNLPSRVYYGVNSDAAITLRLLGVPRSAALPLAEYFGETIKEPLPKLRTRLVQLQPQDWKKALGNSGLVYQHVWRIMEGLEK